MLQIDMKIKKIRGDLEIGDDVVDLWLYVTVDKKHRVEITWSANTVSVDTASQYTLTKTGGKLTYTDDVVAINVEKIGDNDYAVEAKAQCGRVKFDFKPATVNEQWEASDGCVEVTAVAYFE